MNTTTQAESIKTPRLVVSHHLFCVTVPAQVALALNEAIEGEEEGVVLKDPSSPYVPNARKGGWLKIKPDVSFTIIDS